MQIEKETGKKFFNKQRRQKAMPRVIPVGGLDDGPALWVEEGLHPVVQLLPGWVQLSHGPAEVTRHLIQVQGLGERSLGTQHTVTYRG